MCVIPNNCYENRGGWGNRRLHFSISIKICHLQPKQAFIHYIDMRRDKEAEYVIFIVVKYILYFLHCFIINH